MSLTFDPFKLGRSDVTKADDFVLTNPLALIELENYWNSLPKTGGLPRRRDVDPSALTGVLEHCFVLERVAPGMARFRVAGRAIGEVLGMEPRGLPLSTAFKTTSRGALAAYLESVFSGPNRVELSLESPRKIGQPRLQGKILMLPLLDEAGQVTRAIGVLVMSGQRGSGGRQLRITQEASPRVEPIITAPATLRAIERRPLEPAAWDVTMSTEAGPTCHDSKPVTDHLPRQGSADVSHVTTVTNVTVLRQRGHLRLVVSNEQ